MLAANATSHRKSLSQQLALALDVRSALIGVTLASFALRVGLLDRFTFHPDEAIYSYWALYGRHVDPLFLHVWPDKPPILIWLLGWLFELAGATPVMARLPNLIFSTLTVVITGALAQQWWGVRAGLLAALLMALNPFAISFAATAFTDPLMVMAGLLALYTAVRRRWFWSGLWLGVAIMTKQQGLLFAPLVLGVAIGEERGARHGAAVILHWLVGLLLVVAPVVYWDSLRWAVAPSPWDLGARNAAGFTLAPPEQWLPRLWAWLELAHYLLGAVWVWLLLLTAVIVSFCLCNSVSLRRNHSLPTASPLPPAALLPAALLSVWAAGFLTLHVVTAVQVWDRYLLPLAPVVALLGALGAEKVLRRGEWRVARGEGRRVRALEMQSVGALLLGMWLLLLTGSAIDAAQGRLPIGGDRGAYTGVEQVADWLTAQTDALPVVYHRTLGWHFAFLLFTPMQEGSIDVRWVPSAVQLADNAIKTPHRPRYLVETDWSPERNLSLQLAVRGLSAQQRLRAGRFTVYEIVKLTSPPASWRVCRLPSDYSILPRWRVYGAGNQMAVQSRCVMETTQ